jgi:hypothetical protein
MNNTNIEHHLRSEIVAEFGELCRTDIDAEGRKTTVDSLVKLMDRAIEMEKLATEREEREQARKEDRIDRFIKHGLTILGIVVPTVVTVWGTVKTIEFEKEGTFTTIMGRGFVNKLLPKK